MNNYVLVSVVVIALILAFFTSDVLTQKSDPKITTFNESIQLEISGDHQKAIDKLLGIYKDYPDDYLINLRLGWLHYSVEKFNESKDYYNKAITISNRKSIEALLGLTLPLSSLNEWSSVKDTYKEIIKLDNYNYTANLRLGQISLNSGDYISAKQLLEKAHNLYPGYYEPNLSLGYTYFYLGEKKKAEIHLRTALMLVPNDELATKGLKLLK